jgi:hypothetical protein
MPRVALALNTETVRMARVAAIRDVLHIDQYGVSRRACWAIRERRGMKRQRRLGAEGPALAH